MEVVILTGIFVAAMLALGRYAKKSMDAGGACGSCGEAESCSKQVQIVEDLKQSLQ